MFVYVARYHTFTHFRYHMLTLSLSHVHMLLFTVNLNDDAALLVGWCHNKVNEEKVSENKESGFCERSMT